MRIVFMGTPDFSVASLKALLEGGHEVVLAVTQPDRPKGRSKKPLPSPVKVFAEEKGIEVMQPEKVRNEEVIAGIRAYAPQVIVVSAFGQILPGELLALPEYGCLNIHASLLPRYRGASPIQAAILNGEERSGVTIMQMDEGLDTGDILLQKEVSLEPGETGGSLFERLSTLGGEAVLEALSLLEKGELTPVPQDGEKATKTGLIKKRDGEIHWGKSAREIERMIRAFDPWPGAFTLFGEKKLTLLSARVIKGRSGSIPGEIFFPDKNSLAVYCGREALLILGIKPEGKKAMETEEYLRGARLKEGMLFG